MNLELVNYIKQQLQQNTSKNKITDILLGQGWEQSDIDESFSVVEGKNVRAPEIDYSDSVVGDNYDESEGGASGFGRRSLVFVGAGAIILLVLVGIIAAVSMSNKKTSGADELAQENDPSKPVAIINQNNVSENANESGEQNPNNNNGSASAVAQISPEDQKAIIELGKTITVPTGWVPESRLSGTRPVVIFNKPTLEKDSSGADIFNENISITRGSFGASGAVGVPDYIAKSKEALQKMISDYKFTAEKNVKLADGTVANLLGSSYTLDGVPVRNMQLFAIRGDEVYIITGIVVASNWEKEKDMIGEAVLSFKYPGAK